MKKIVSNILVVSAQLMVGVLFLCMLFSDSNEDLKVVVVKNDNLNKMADSVSALFKEEDGLINIYDDFREFELFSSEYEESLVDEIVEEEIEEVVEEVEPQEIIVVDPSGYTSNEERGFVVTTDNKTYNLSDEELYVVSSVVTCEANKSSRDDILGVMSVILNRADANGISPAKVVAAAGQFECYKMLFIDGTHSVVSTSLVNQVISDALNGIRNNEYMGFNSWYSYQYSDNYIIERGNRYR